MSASPVSVPHLVTILRNYILVDGQVDELPDGTFSSAFFIFLSLALPAQLPKAPVKTKPSALLALCQQMITFGDHAVKSDPDIVTHPLLPIRHTRTVAAEV
jgi:hypothetical protein